MTQSAVPSPDNILSLSDPGDDTARRFYYQWTFAAIVCSMLLDKTEDAVEVFCEHHEDVLIKHSDGTFSGLQIKTKASDQDVWKANDEAVRNSCVRFVKLDIQFPGRFRKFRFLTNHPLHAAANSQDLRHILRLIKESNSVSNVSKVAVSFLTRIAKEAKCTAEIAFLTLCKVDATDELPKIADIEMRLVTTLTNTWQRAAECMHISIVRAARTLVNECGRASSLAHQDVLPAYLPVMTDPISANLAARLAAKRIDQSRVLELLEHGINETATLDADPRLCVEPGTGEKSLLLKKLDAGGFSAISRNSAEDLRNKADYLGMKWTNQYGRDKGLQRYGHVRSLVLSDAARAFETIKGENFPTVQPFGPKMLSELRGRFKERRSEGSELYECSNEHLEGFAYSLTSECKVQWSLDRPWEEE